MDDKKIEAKYYGGDSNIPAEIRESLYREFTEFRDYCDRNNLQVPEIDDFRVGFVRGYNAAQAELRDLVEAAEEIHFSSTEAIYHFESGKWMESQYGTEYDSAPAAFAALKGEK